MKERKPFKETAVGKWLKDKFPDVLSVASQLTGIEALDKVGELIGGKTMSDEERAEIQTLLYQQELELYKMELQDIQNARHREIEITKATGKSDNFQRVVGGIGLGLLTIIVVYALFWDIRNPEEFAHVKGLVEGIALTIFTYFFGSSGGSKKKQELIEKLTK